MKNLSFAQKFGIAIAALVVLIGIVWAISAKRKNADVLADMPVGDGGATAFPSAAVTPTCRPKGSIFNQHLPECPQRDSDKLTAASPQKG